MWPSCISFLSLRYAHCRAFPVSGGSKSSIEALSVKGSACSTGRLSEGARTESSGSQKECASPHAEGQGKAATSVNWMHVSRHPDIPCIITMQYLSLEDQAHARDMEALAFKTQFSNHSCNAGHLCHLSPDPPLPISGQLAS